MPSLPPPNTTISSLMFTDRWPCRGRGCGPDGLDTRFHFNSEPPPIVFRAAAPSPPPPPAVVDVLGVSAGVVDIVVVAIDIVAMAPPSSMQAATAAEC